MASARRTFGSDPSTIGENLDLPGDLARRRVVIGRSLHPGYDLHITPVGAKELHASVVAAVHRDARRGRHSVSAHLADPRPVIVPAALTVGAPTLGALVGLRGPHGWEQEH